MPADAPRAPLGYPHRHPGPRTPQRAAQAAPGASARPFQADLLDGRRKRRNPTPRTPEHQEQVTLMQWATLHERRWPELALLHAVPNGGHRHKATAAALKAAGVKRGVPDLDLPVPRGHWHGLRIELKAQGGRLAPEQQWWIEQLLGQGYCAVACVGWEAARDTILVYLNLGSPTA